MRNSLVCLLFTTSLLMYAQEKQPISGFVFINGEPLPSASISILGTEQGTVSDTKGRYQLSANINDTLKFSYVGYHDILKVVQPDQMVLNVSMQTKVIPLDNVELEQTTKRKSPKDLLLEYDQNPDVIITQFGILDKKRSGHTMYVLTEEEFNRDAPDFGTAVRGRFPKRAPSRSIYDVNPSAIYDIDGMVFTSFPGIPPSFIKRVAYIPGLSGVTLYGTLGRNGVYVINTFNYGYPKKSEAHGKNISFLNNIFYEDEAADSKTQFLYLPSNVKRLFQSETGEAAKQQYMKELEGSASGDFLYMAYALDYFLKFWKDEGMVDTILDHCYSKSRENPQLLTALAYLLESNGRYDKAQALFKDVFISEPNQQKSYLNLFSIYNSSNETDKANNMLARYFYLIDNGFLPRTPNPINNFLKNSYAQRFLKQENENDELYLMVEWNNPEAEFELQFVDPENRVFNWDSTSEMDKNGGVGACTEFILDKSNGDGRWLLNTKFKGPEGQIPTVLKCTFYFNYGTSDQKKWIYSRVISESTINKEVLRFNYHQILNTNLN